MGGDDVAFGLPRRWWTGLADAVEGFAEPAPRPKEVVEMPDLVGMRFREAADVCQSLDLQLDFEPMEHVNVAVEGRVTFQDPAPGTRMGRERDVKVYMTYPGAPRRTSS